MLIKQRLRIQTIIAVVTASLMLLVLGLALYRVNHALEEDGIAEELAIGAFERNAFRSDYLRNNNERARVQWFAKHEQLGKFLQLAKEKFQEVEGEKAVAALIKDHESSGKIFSDLVENREKKRGDAASAALSQETENRLATQLEMRLYQRILLARTLRDVARNHLVSAFKLAGWGAFGVLLILIAAVLINSWAMGRTIADRIGRLRDGAAVIGAGDLDYRIAIPGDDEFAQLSGAFNAMTAKLGLSYHNLEKEVEERKRAEEALRQSRDGLELRVRERTRELEEANAAVREMNETLEQRVAERAAALQAANASLRDSRRAAINLMEDAIAARREAEAANVELRESEQRLNKAQEISHLGSWELDIVRNSLTWSDEVYRIFGFQPQEFDATYEAFLAAVHPEDRAAVDDAYSGSLKEGRDAYEIEHRVVRKTTGEVRIVREKCEHIRDGAGRIVRSVGMVHDITDLKRAEEEREIAAGFLRIVNESKNRDGLVRSAAGYLREHSGCEAVGIRLKDGDDYPYYEVRGFPEQFIRLENSLCVRDEAGLPIRDSAGNPVMDCMCGNVIQGRFDPLKPFFTARGSFWTNSTTELLAATTEADRQARTRNRCNGEGYESVALIAILAGAEPLGLLQLNDRRPGRFSPERIALWERLAGYLGIALEKFRAERSLEQSVAELAAANKELESFIYSVSHDLHGPLRSIGIFAKIIAKDHGDRLDEKGRDYLRRIEKAGGRMDRIIIDLLHLSRVSRYESLRMDVDLSALAQNIVAGLRESSPNRDVEVAIQEGLIARCDPQLMELALSNLLGNAWKFTSKTAQGSIAFGTVEQEGEIVYYVRDNGAGFDPAYAGKMFSPFQRLHNEDEFEGTGIGLAIVELAIRRHGGKVWAEGEVGKGATVFFTLA